VTLPIRDGYCLKIKQKKKLITNKKHTYSQILTAERIYQVFGNAMEWQRSIRWIAPIEHSGLDARTVQRAANHPNDSLTSEN